MKKIMELEQKLNSKVEEKFEFLGNAWEHYKSVNEERLAEIEKKGSADPLTEEKFNRIGEIIGRLEEHRTRINNLEAAVSRPQQSSREFGTKGKNDEYGLAFDNYLRKGIDSDLYNWEQKRDLTSSSSGDSYGGFLLTPSVQKMLLDKIEERCVMRKICSTQEISSQSLDVLIGSGMEPSWIGETGAVSDTNTSIFTKKTVTAFDLVAQPKATQRLIDDSAIDLEEWLANRLADDFIGAEEDAFVNGAGASANKPAGIIKYVLSGSIAKIKSTVSAGFFNENDIIDLYYSLDDKYLHNASFLMSKTAIKEIRLLKDGVTGNYIWSPALLAGQQSSLLGCPVYTNAYVPALAEDSISIIFGDFKYYQIVDRVGVRILRDPFTSKPYVRFYTTKRVGGDVIDMAAFKALEAA
ncbi:MAG: phage major capsid protein [Rickettsiales bacterium]|jgi:HK97 family phage major capsid protein|nr:phage major capsid protein [Rickettsiales bacterium]